MPSSVVGTREKIPGARALDAFAPGYGRRSEKRPSRASSPAADGPANELEACAWILRACGRGHAELRIVRAARELNWPTAQVENFLHRLEESGVVQLLAGARGPVVTANVHGISRRRAIRLHGECKAAPIPRRRRGCVYIAYSPDVAHPRLKVGFSARPLDRSKSLSGGTADHVAIDQIKHRQAQQIERLTHTVLSAFRAPSKQYGREVFEAPEELDFKSFYLVVRRALDLAVEAANEVPAAALFNPRARKRIGEAKALLLADFVRRLSLRNSPKINLQTGSRRDPDLMSLTSDLVPA